MISRLDGKSRTLLLVALVAVIARILAAIWLGDSLYFDDEAVYLDSARELANSGQFDHGYRREPVYPLFLAFVGMPFGQSVLGFRLGQAIVVGLGCVILYRLGRSLFGSTVALAGALIYAFDPLLTVSGSLLYSETVAAVMVMMVAYLLFRATSEDSLPLTLCLAAAIGLLAQIRQVAIVLLGVALVWLWTRLPTSVGRRLQHVALLILITTATLIPWTIRNYGIYHRVVPLAPSGFSGTTELTTEEAFEKGFARSFLAWIRENPVPFVAELGCNFVRFWEPFPTRLWADDVEKSARLHDSDPRLPQRPRLAMRSRDVVSTVCF